jgi:large subunit ribosomal protein L25
MTTLQVSTRTILGKLVRSVRHTGSIPGVIYGHGVTPAAISVDRLAFEKAYRQVGESTLVDLVLDGGKPIKVLVQEVQHDPRSGTPTHVDFHQVRMDEELMADIPLNFVGEPKAVKDLGGILIKNLDHLKVKCLPSALVHEIIVDITGISELNRGFLVKEITIPAGLELITPADEVAVIVAPPRSEAELAELKTEVKEDVSAVEKIEEKKPEEGEAEEAKEPKGKA